MWCRRMRSASSSAESSSIFALYSKCMYPFLGVHVTLGNRLELLQQLGLPTRQSVIAMVVMTGWKVSEDDVMELDVSRTEEDDDAAEDGHVGNGATAHEHNEHEFLGRCSDMSPKEDDPTELHGNGASTNSQLAVAETWENWEGKAVRNWLLQVLASRRKKEVNPPEISLGKHHNQPYYQQESSFVNPQVLSLCPKADGDQHDEKEFEEEDLVLRVEEGEQGKVPFLIIRQRTQHPSKKQSQRPAVICLHSTGNSKETMRPFMKAYASLGYIAVGVDARNHGDRGHTPHAYANALVAAWKTGEEMPFLFDTVWDLIKLMDYLTGRPDIDPSRIGMMGISLGGMHTWFAAAADPRIAVAVSLIGVQSFGWAVGHDQWHARVASIPQPFEAAAKDLGKSNVDSETVTAVWQRLAPGIIDFLDSPHTIPAIAPRPLLIHNGKLDPRCPVEGLEQVVRNTVERYNEAGVPQHFKFIVEEGLGHSVTEAMGEEALCWFNKFLRPGSKCHNGSATTDQDDTAIGYWPQPNERV